MRSLTLDELELVSGGDWRELVQTLKDAWKDFVNPDRVEEAEEAQRRHERIMAAINACVVAGGTVNMAEGFGEVTGTWQTVIVGANGSWFGMNCDPPGN